MSVDFRDLNKASPKDNFSLPYMDVLVDNTICHALLPFMDGYVGYDQVIVAKNDMEKTTFIILWGAYYYIAMPFRLKNVPGHILEDIKHYVT